MKKILIVLLLLPSLALAQAFRQVGSNVIVESESGEVLIATKGEKPIKLCNNTNSASAFCPITVESSGQVTNKFQPATVVTPASNVTPVAAAILAQPRSIIATAAPTANYVFLPLASAQKAFVTDNDSANPVQIMPQSTDVINAAAALTPYACATTKRCECDPVTAAKYKCTSK